MLARSPTDAEVDLQLGHSLKLQAWRAAAFGPYRRAAELAPFLIAPQRELFNAGERVGQERLSKAQPRLDGIDALIEVSQCLAEVRAALDRIAEMLPEIQAQLAFPVAGYDRFRGL
jgi:hypothetical protein